MEPHYLGVRKRSSGKYTAEICCKYKREYLGMFKTAEEAARAYDAAARRLRPDKTKTNFPQEEEPAGGGQYKNPSAASNPNSHSLPPSTSNSTTGSTGGRRIVDVDLNGPPPPHYF